MGMKEKEFSYERTYFWQVRVCDAVEEKRRRYNGEEAKLQDYYDLVPQLEPHVKVVSANQLISMALQQHKRTREREPHNV